MVTEKKFFFLEIHNTILQRVKTHQTASNNQQKGH